jgi:hypothetical protein
MKREPGTVDGVMLAQHEGIARRLIDHQERWPVSQTSDGIRE